MSEMFLTQNQNPEQYAPGFFVLYQQETGRGQTLLAFRAGINPAPTIDSELIEAHIFPRLPH